MPFNSETVASSSMTIARSSRARRRSLSIGDERLGPAAGKFLAPECEAYRGRSILQVVGSAVAFPSTLASVFQPSPDSSLSYFTFFDNVET